MMLPRSQAHTHRTHTVMHWQTLLFITEFPAVLSLFHSWRLSHVLEGFPINKQQRKALKLWGTVAVIIFSHFAPQTSCVARWSRGPQRLIMWWTMKDAQPRANGLFIFQLQNLLTHRVVSFFFSRALYWAPYSSRGDHKHDIFKLY